MIFVLLLLVGCALGQQSQQLPIQQVVDTVEDNWEPESHAAQYLGLPSGASRVVPNIRTSFSCIGRRYGYFADVDNNCQIFHICQPSVRANGQPVIYHYSKYCPQNSRFDQRALTCVPITSPVILPCAESVRYFPLAESRFAEVPIQQVIEQLPEPIEQRQPIPVQQINGRVPNLTNVNIPRKTLSRNQLVAAPSQPVVVQAVQQPLPVQQFVQQPRDAVKRLVQTTVPLTGYQQITNVPLRAAQPFSLKNIQSQVLTSQVQQPIVEQRGVNIIQTPAQILRQPSVQTIPQSLYQTIPQSLYQTIPQTIPQTVPVLAQQPIQQQVFEQRAEEVAPQAFAQTVGQTVGQPQTLPVQLVQAIQQQPLDQRAQAIPQPQVVQQPIVQAVVQQPEAQPVAPQPAVQPVAVPQQIEQQVEGAVPQGVPQAIQQTTLDQREEGIVERPAQTNDQPAPVPAQN